LLEKIEKKINVEDTLSHLGIQ